MTEAIVRRQVRITGTVQGVFFRDSCRARAGEAGVAGWVTNRADGTVEAQFEGGPVQVDAMVDWCRHGPPGASVERVDVTDQQPVGDQGFVIR